MEVSFMKHRNEMWVWTSSHLLQLNFTVLFCNRSLSSLRQALFSLSPQGHPASLNWRPLQIWKIDFFFICYFSLPTCSSLINSLRCLSFTLYMTCWNSKYINTSPVEWWWVYSVCCRNRSTTWFLQICTLKAVPDHWYAHYRILYFLSNKMIRYWSFCVSWLLLRLLARWNCS